MKKITFLMATAFVLLSGKAQAQFAEISSDLDPQTGDIVAADINNDGLLDIVFSGRTENVVKGGVFINRGNGVYEDCNDCDDLRDDMIFKTCAGRLPQTGLSLASQPTMSRLENSIKSQDLYRIGQELVDTFVESYDREPGVIILDCDDTNNNTYGQLS